MGYESIDDDGRDVRTRKPHRCEWCGEMITKGDTAVIRTYKWDDDFNAAHQHPECYKAMVEYTGISSFDGEFDSGGMMRGHPLHSTDTFTVADAEKK